MAIKVGELYAELTLRDQGFNTGLTRSRARFSTFNTGLSKDLDNVSNKASSFARTTRIASLAAAGGLYFAGKAASDLGETISFSEKVFKSHAGEMRKWAGGALDSMGLATETALDAANGFGGLFKTTGSTIGEASKLSQTMVQLAVDMSSAKNVPLEEALLALKSGLIGEAEPMRRFNVLLSENEILQYAVRNGIAKQGQELTEAQKVQARYGLVLEQTKDVQGDYKDTADSAANSQRFAMEAAKKSAATLGRDLAPVMADVAQFASKMVRGFTALPEPIKQTTIALLALTALSSPLGSVVAGVTKLSSVGVRSITRVRGLQAAAALGGESLTFLGAAAKLALPVLTRLGAVAIPVGGYVLYKKAVDSTAESVERLDATLHTIQGTVGSGGGGFATQEEADRYFHLSSLIQRYQLALSQAEGQHLTLNEAIFKTNRDLERLGINWETADPVELISALERLYPSLRITNDILGQTGGEAQIAGRKLARLDNDVDRTRQGIQRFAGMTKPELEAWKDETTGNLDLVGMAFDKLADRNKVTADDLIRQYRRMIRSTDNFTENIKMLWKRGTPDDVIKDLIDRFKAGDESGALFAQTLVDGSKKATRSLKGLNKDGTSEVQELKKFLDKLGGTFERDVPTAAEKGARKLKATFGGAYGWIGKQTNTFVTDFLGAINFVRDKVGLTGMRAVDAPKIHLNAGFAKGKHPRDRGGLAWVGERGPEIMHVPDSASIVPAQKANELPDYIKKRIPGYAKGKGMFGTLLELLHPGNDPDHPDHLHAAISPLSALIKLGQFLIRGGFSVAEHPSFPPFNPAAHDPDGYHNTNPPLAIDVNSAAGTSAAEQSTLIRLAKWIQSVTVGGPGVAFPGAGGAMFDPKALVKKALEGVKGLALPGAFQEIGAKVTKDLVGGLVGKAGSWAGSAGVGGNAGQWISQAFKLLAAHGIKVPAWITPSGIAQLMGEESGGDPTAVNTTPVSSGQHATGVMQTIPSTFAAYALKAFGNIMNPVHNIMAAIRYIMADKDPSFGFHAPYANGGRIPEPVFGIGRSGRTYSFAERNPENVLTDPQLMALAGGHHRPGGPQTLVLQINGPVYGDKKGIRKLANDIEAELTRKKILTGKKD